MDGRVTVVPRNSSSHALHTLIGNCWIAFPQDDSAIPVPSEMLTSRLHEAITYIWYWVDRRTRDPTIQTPMCFLRIEADPDSESDWVPLLTFRVAMLLEFCIVAVAMSVRGENRFTVNFLLVFGWRKTCRTMHSDVPRD